MTCLDHSHASENIWWILTPFIRGTSVYIIIITIIIIIIIITIIIIIIIIIIIWKPTAIDSD